MKQNPSLSVKIYKKQRAKFKPLVLKGIAKATLGGRKNIIKALVLFEKAANMGSFSALLHGQDLVKKHSWLKDWILQQGENDD